MEAIETYKISETLELRIFNDDMAENPRTMWDNAATMICFHKRYNLGDKHDYSQDDFENWDELREQIEKDHEIAAILPLYLYDHSGITISTTPFSCRWDSGQVGWVFMTMIDATLSELVREKAEQLIRAEVKEYDQYLTGDVYGFQLVEKSICSECDKEHEEILDSCWGFFGDDIKENGILDCLSKEDREAVLQQV